MRDQQLVLRYAPRRVRWWRCGPRVEEVPWANRSDAALSLALARLAKTVAAAVKTAVQEGLLHRRWKPLRVIGMVLYDVESVERHQRPGHVPAYRVEVEYTCVTRPFRMIVVAVAVQIKDRGTSAYHDITIL